MNLKSLGQVFRPQAPAAPPQTPPASLQTPLVAGRLDQLDQVQLKQLNEDQRFNLIQLHLLNPTQSGYERAVVRLQNRVTQDLQLQDTSQPRDLYLRENMEPILLTQPRPTDKGSVIMLHGYTAGPWQYQEPAEDFHAQGYNVYVPRIPGHGLMKADGTPTGEKMLGFDQQQEYLDFVDQVFEEVNALGGPVHVIGLSGGGSLALAMAERHPQIKGVVSMAPYIGPNQAIKPVSGAIQFLHEHTPLKMGHLLSTTDYNENIKVQADFPLPHTQGTYENAVAMLNVGANVDDVEVPVQFFTTEDDILSGEAPVEALIERSGGLSQHGWYHFEEEDKVPHAMASPVQNTEPGRSEQLWDMIFKSIDSGELHTRRPRPEAE